MFGLLPVCPSGHGLLFLLEAGLLWFLWLELGLLWFLCLELGLIFPLGLELLSGLMLFSWLGLLCLPPSGLLFPARARDALSLFAKAWAALSPWAHARAAARALAWAALSSLAALAWA